MHLRNSGNTSQHQSSSRDSPRIATTSTRKISALEPTSRAVGRRVEAQVDSSDQSNCVLEQNDSCGDGSCGYELHFLDR